MPCVCWALWKFNVHLEILKLLQPPVYESKRKGQGCFEPRPRESIG